MSTDKDIDIFLFFISVIVLVIVFLDAIYRPGHPSMLFKIVTLLAAWVFFSKGFKLLFNLYY